MKNINELNELETSEKLNELIEHIEKNNWEHLYSTMDIVVNLNNTVINLAGEKRNLIDDIIILKDKIKEATQILKY